MPQTFYHQTGPVKDVSTIDTSALKDKVAIITGGCSGLGYCYAKALVTAGCFVVLADLTPPPEPFEEPCGIYVKCDVTVWAEQQTVFETAAQRSSTGKIDIVIANAGVAGPDIFTGLDDDVPQPPQTGMIDVNVIGVIYTAKLAGWYFSRHHQDPLDGCLILIGSIMGYIDTQSSAIYSASKFAIRGIMCCLRRKGVLRVNTIAPWMIETPIMSKDFLASIRPQLQQMGLDLALAEDAVGAVLRIATDRTINGHSLAVVPRQLALTGYMDLDLDDFKSGSPADTLQRAASALDYSQFRHALS
ncbi:hypothetical protein FE257_001698 [Aspergillus nanangensis]|uniref:Uncharacterized protein n=1 Tax=Aspergillus nanangensis TaxID=2582783 RepID=A0AAD4CDL3_ASPNN|nr:hypothetical protein FE257_001698 [Aspergillus nanangensis]